MYLAQHGYEVTAVDTNANALQALQAIVQDEGLSGIDPRVYDLNEARLVADEYDFIVCTVTLMFLNPNKMPAIIANMQEATKKGGHHLIVCAMDTQAYPCPVNFPFTMGEGELKKAYEGWEFLTYNENLGTMHNGARLQFATMLARK